MKTPLRLKIVTLILLVVCLLPSANAQLSGTVHVDSEFEIYLSTNDSEQGVLIASGDNWPTAYSFTGTLDIGQDYFLHIRGVDVGGVAGFLGEFEIAGSEHTFANGLTTLNTNTTDWLVSTSGWNNYQVVSSYGANGVSPWGSRATVDANAQWIWSADNDVDNLNFFTTKISAPANRIPIASYRFDESQYNNLDNEVVDSIGGFNGRALNTQPVKGKICNALDFTATGTSDYIILNEDVLDGATDFSISVWVKTPKTGETTIISGARSGSSNELLMYFRNQFDAAFFLIDRERLTLESESIAGDVWNHLVWTRAGSQSCFYRNKVLQGCAAVPATAISIQSLILGQEQDNVGGGFVSAQALDGLLDELLIFDEALSQSQIADIYDNQDSGLNYDGQPRMCPPSEVVAGQVTLRNTANEPAFTAVCFDTPFSQVPRVFSLPTTANSSDRLTLRIRNVTETGFEIAQVESPENANPNPPAGNVSQTVDFLAIVEGDYALEGGAKMRVSSLDTTRFQGRRLSGASWESISVADMGFADDPSIIASIQTMNNETEPFPISDPFLATSIQRVNRNDFEIALERGETNTGSVNNAETLAYIALSANTSGQFARGIAYESILSSQSVNGIDTCTTVNFANTYSRALPLVIASQNTRNGGDGGWLRRCDISSTGVGLSVVEDMASDADIHHINEIAGGIVLSGNFSNQTCAVQPSVLHHYEIVHDGQGLTCETEAVTIKACANESCSNLSTQVVTLDFLANGVLVSTESFTGSTNVDVSQPNPATLSYSIVNASVGAANPVVCDDGITNSCDMVFEDAGFRFLNGNSGVSETITNQIAGTSFPLRLQAVQNNNGVCEGIFTGNQNIDLSQENVNPGGVSGLSFSVDGNDIAKYSGATSITLDFGSDSIAPVPSAIYFDAGQIRLRASYDVGGVSLLGSSNPFWVSPAELAISASVGSTALIGASASATPTHQAGEDFRLSVRALNGLGNVTPNYTPGQIQLQLARTAPTLSGSVDGSFTYASGASLASSISPSFTDVSLSSFTAGISSFEAAQYSEVGLLNLDAQDSNYGNVGMVVPASAINVGRFTPHHFEQTVAQDGLFQATCDTRPAFSAYSGQKDQATGTIGAISYLSNPVLAITAYNKQGVITQNYFEDSQGSANDFMKLSNASVGITVPIFDQVAVGVDGSLLPLTASISPGTLSQNDLTALPSVVALPKGVVHYQLSSSDHFFYNRSANALVRPFRSDIDFSVATIADTDNVNVTSTSAASPTGVEIRFGRLVLENSFGPETANFPQPMRLEHYDGSGFTDSLVNSCESFDASRISLSNISLDPALTAVLGSTGSFINGKTEAIGFQATGAGNQGQIGVSYDSFDWLKYDWDDDGDYDDDPTAVAIFGLFRGDDRLIHWREAF